MARKPSEKPPTRAARADRRRPPAMGHALERQTAGPRQGRQGDSLQVELATAKARIAQLEKSHAEVLRRLELAIQAVHKLLES